MEDAYGYVPISRKLFEHAFWTEERELSRFEAWVDMIQMAAFKAFQKVVGSAIIPLQEGELLASQRYLAKRWRWTEKKVRIFLSVLVKSEQIRAQRETTEGQVYLLVNYDRYRPEGRTEGAEKGARGAQLGRTKGAAGAHEGRKEEEVREEKEEKEVIHLVQPTVERKEPEGFPEFWSAYPKKRGKGAARRRWEHLRSTGTLPSLALLLQAIALQSASPQWLKNGGEFIPLPETWLNQERWTDDFRVTPPAASKATPFNPPVARRRLYERAAAALAGGQVSPAIHDAWIPKIDGVSTREAAEGLWKEIPG